MNPYNKNLMIIPYITSPTCLSTYINYMSLSPKFLTSKSQHQKRLDMCNEMNNVQLKVNGNA